MRIVTTMCRGDVQPSTYVRIRACHVVKEKLGAVSARRDDMAKTSSESCFFTFSTRPHPDVTVCALFQRQYAVVIRILAHTFEFARVAS